MGGAAVTRETFAPWDMADYIDTAEDARLHLEAAVDEDPGDGSLIRAALDAIARAQNMSALARDTGLSRGNLYRAMSKDGNMTLNTLLKITRALGLRLRLEVAEDTQNTQAAP